MRRLRVAFLLLLIALMVPAVPQSDMKKSFNFFIGQKQIDDLEDLDLDKQLSLGVEMSFGGYDWPVMLAVDIMGSVADEEIFGDDYYYGYYDYDLESRTIEVDFGVRKTWEIAGSAVRPYLGAGIAGARTELEIDDGFFGSESVDANGFGFWFGGGIYWKLGDSFNLGLNVRHSTIDVEFDELGDEDIDVGGWHGGLLLGWGF
ncbi:MAG TPA: outer membrane beta-barrel protein [Candidatus Polarisedimenticolia bacterium]|nr:outer membrane beta-barrel protein [Candidatus Polarisedimenticolia bacterium]